MDRKRIESMPKKVPHQHALVAAVGLQWDLANTNGIDKFFRRDVREGKEKTHAGWPTKCFLEAVTLD